MPSPPRSSGSPISRLPLLFKRTFFLSIPLYLKVIVSILTADDDAGVGCKNTLKEISDEQSDTSAADGSKNLIFEAMAFVYIPVQNSEEEVRVALDQLPRDATDILDILKAEQAPLDLWLIIAVMILIHKVYDEAVEFVGPGCGGNILHG
ncbi:hypothetical protein LXL04_012774 [Taraxacum kok-saghyz]